MGCIELRIWSWCSRSKRQEDKRKRTLVLFGSCPRPSPRYSAMLYQFRIVGYFLKMAFPQKPRREMSVVPWNTLPSLSFVELEIPLRKSSLARIPHYCYGFWGKFWSKKSPSDHDSQPPSFTYKKKDVLTLHFRRNFFIFLLLPSHFVACPI